MTGRYLMDTSIWKASAFILAFVGLAACTPAERRAERPQSTTTPGLETGITETGGGGQAALRNNVDVGVKTQCLSGNILRV